ncbi:hypothetical protein E4198_18725 [Streptomyces sp. RKND-216]|uniref:hypothetical protein n=1 Tax=Streptomyces sp. RKND-216 TaxID=2562581 RepID=UPI00109D857F|nr:hypothetical protein [Streptomyces sp. RKND-216]THA26446.1 hypothetical protein E4198_18725 [Streptomyces sp. RKND-216]
MYLRKTQRKNRDGRVVRYLQIARNQRVDGTTRAEILLSFGREDALDPGVLRRLADSIHRYLGETSDATQPLAESLPQVEAARPVGAAWLLDGLWQALGIGPALTRLLGDAGAERVVFALVANRALAPESPRPLHRWAAEEVVVPGLSELDGNGAALAAMDRLLEREADLRRTVREGMARARGAPKAWASTRPRDLVFFDAPGTDGLPPLLVGLAVTDEGLPVGCWSWHAEDAASAPGDCLADVPGSAAAGSLRTVVVRSSRRSQLLASEPGLRPLVVTGESLRTSSETSETLPHLAGRHRRVGTDLTVRELRLGEDGRRRRVLWRSTREAEHEAVQRAAQLDFVRAELAWTTADSSRRCGPDSSAQQELLGHPLLGRWLSRCPGTGSLVVDPDAVDADARLDGAHLLTPLTSDVGTDQAAAGYAALLRTERAFSAMASPRYFQPVYHRLEDRGRAHVLLCWLALLLTSVAELRTARPWASIAGELNRVRKLTFRHDGGHRHRLSRVDAAQERLFAACGVPVPSRAG